MEWMSQNTISFCFASFICLKVFQGGSTCLYCFLVLNAIEQNFPVQIQCLALNIWLKSVPLFNWIMSLFGHWNYFLFIYIPKPRLSMSNAHILHWPTTSLWFRRQYAKLFFKVKGNEGFFLEEKYQYWQCFLGFCGRVQATYWQKAIPFIIEENLKAVVGRLQS